MGIDARTKEIIKTMRTGIMGPFWPTPANLTTPLEKCSYLVKETHALGCRCIHLSMIEHTPEFLAAFAEILNEHDMEIDGPASGTFQILEKGKEARDMLATCCRSVKALGGNIVRGGYGTLRIEKSRFNKSIAISDHLKILEGNLREAAKIMEDEDCYLAIENHCDFKGVELASVLEAVGSKRVGCALDTANAWTVLCDPEDDIAALAKYAITTHMKDMKILQQNIPSRIPFYPIGCVLGEGFVRVKDSILTLAGQSPFAEGLHLIIELGWMEYGTSPNQEQRDALQIDVFKRSLKNLDQMLAELAA